MLVNINATLNYSTFYDLLKISLRSFSRLGKVALRADGFFTRNWPSGRLAHIFVNLTLYNFDSCSEI